MHAVHDAYFCSADQNLPKAVGRFGEGAAPRSRAQLCVNYGEGKQAARPQRGAARPIPNEQRRERQLFTRLYGGWAQGARADRLGPLAAQVAADVLPVMRSDEG